MDTISANVNNNICVLHLALASTFKFAKIPGAQDSCKHWTMVAGASQSPNCPTVWALQLEPNNVHCS